MAPTTLLGMKTTTSPYGRSVANEGYPFALRCWQHGSPAYIERVAITGRKMSWPRAAIRKAIQCQIEGRGFSLVELLSTCPTGWKLTPPAAKKWLVENMLPVFPLGVYRDKKENAVKVSPSNGMACNAETVRRLLDIPGEKNGDGKNTAKGAPLSPRVKIAGFGGQGILFIGVALAEAGMRAGRQVSWLPSYGPEMRGGTANCHVMISDQPIGSPLVSETDVLVAMNRPSLEKFQSDVCPGGLILYDSSLISGVVPQGGKNVRVIAVPATKIADELGNTKVANVVMLGAYLALSNLLPDSIVLSAINEKAHSRPELADLNTKALLAGKEFVLLGSQPLTATAPPETIH
jgi:2-oxoisovalerate ferredoxin oxidoreductase beta subunit